MYIKLIVFGIQIKLIRLIKIFKSGYANICLKRFLLDWSVKRSCFITTALQLSFSVCRYKGPRKVQGIETEWYILASEDINTMWKNTKFY